MLHNTKYRSLFWILFLGLLLEGGCNSPQEEANLNTLEVHYGGILNSAEIYNETSNMLPLEPAGSFGASAVSLGDLDGPEGEAAVVVAVGAHDTSNSTLDEFLNGSVYLLWLLPNGSILKSQKIDRETESLNPYLYETSRFGYSVEALGDLDGPGDYAQVLAVGAPFHIAKSEYPDYYGRGGVFLLWLYPDGSVGKVVVIDKDSHNAPLLREQVQFGIGIAFLGDLDGPGGADFALAVGAPSSSFPDPGDRESEGELHILFLYNDGSIANSILFDSEHPSFPKNLDYYDEFGYGLANLGDLDGAEGSSATVLAVGAPSISDENRHAGLGEIFLLWLNPDGSLLRISRIWRDSPQAPPIEEGSYFGIDIAALGDIDGEGGAAQLIAVGQYRALWLLSLAKDGSILGHTMIDHSTPNGIPFDPNAISNGYGSAVTLLKELGGEDQNSLVIGVGDPTFAGHSGKEHLGGSFYLHYILLNELQ